MTAGSWLRVTRSPQERGELPDVWTRRGWPGVGGRDTTEAGWRPRASLGSRMEGRRPSSKDTRGLSLRAATRRGPAVHGGGFRAAAGCWGWEGLPGHPRLPGAAASFCFSILTVSPWSHPTQSGTFYEQQSRRESAVFGISVLKPHLSGSPCARGQLHTRVEIEPDN